MEKPITASAIISFTEKTENDTIKLYEEMADRFPQEKETFLLFAKEGEKNKVLVKRTYQETISDALEACFSFEDLNLEDYIIDTQITTIRSYSEALQKAIALEEQITKFYLHVAECSESLLATIPRAFKKVAEKRKKHMLKLKSLLDNL